MRFSLWTLLSLVMLLGSGALLWMHWEPWYVLFKSRDHDDEGHIWKSYYSPDGRMLALASIDGGIEIIDACSGEPVVKLATDPTRYSSAKVTFSLDSKRVVTSLTALRMWDVPSGREVWTFKFDSGDALYRFGGRYPHDPQFTPDGKWIVGDRVYGAWDSETGVPRVVLPCRTWMPDEAELDYLNQHPDVIPSISSATSLEVFSKFEGVTNIYATRSANAKCVLTSISGMVQKQIWDISSGKAVSRIDIAQEVDDHLPAAFSPDGSLLCAFMENDKTVGVWDTGSGKQIASLSGLPVPYIYAEISADNKRLLAHYYRDLHAERLVRSGFEHLDETRVVRVWDIERQTALTTIDGINVGNAFPGTFSPDGDRIATSDEVYDSTLGKTVLTFHADQHDYEYYSERFAGFSPDGRSVVTSCMKDKRCYARVFYRRRLESWWGLAWLPEFWMVVAFAGAFLWSVRRDWKMR